MMKLIQLVSALSVLCVSSGHVGGRQLALQDLSPQVYCGRVLARALALICFEEEAVDKRSEGTMYNSILAPYYKGQEAQYPWVSPQKARAMGLPSRGKRMGIVDECCEKACGIEELQSYC